MPGSGLIRFNRWSGPVFLLCSQRICVVQNPHNVSRTAAHCAAWMDAGCWWWRRLAADKLRQHAGISPAREKPRCYCRLFDPKKWMENNACQRNMTTSQKKLKRHIRQKKCGKWTLNLDVLFFLVARCKFMNHFINEGETYLWEFG